MISRRFYYALKPFLPWRLRMSMRRFLARRQLAAHAQTWPISESAARVPANWSGWPGNAKFAVVLTHDVESAEGLAKCQRLMQLEMELGFRSSFGFIPEGEYRLPAELRAELERKNFELVVHDLNHDGKLYLSKKVFSEKAKRINCYMRDWNAQGFRAGFMFHNLAWSHQLDIAHDGSTFDTDPFEPQSDGVNTIFPFWVPSGGIDESSSANGRAVRTGFVELPYTLPQDSTLFLLLKEKSPDIWLRKLDWIAAHGGMALINVHPDYLCFKDEKPSSYTFPVSHYVDLLQHIRSKHAGQYVNMLPREVASWVNAKREADAAAGRGYSIPRGLRGKRAAVLLYSTYPADPRPRRAAEAMIEAGMEVDLLCLAENDEEPLEEVVGGVRVYRQRMKRQRTSVWNYFWQYGRFISSSFWFLTRGSMRQKYDVVHVHNMPDVLVFAALVPKLLGTKLILDLHDPMPELMTTIFGASPDSFKIKLLKRLEKWSLGFAHSIITVNECCRKIFSARSCPADKIHVVMNTPDEVIFRARTSPDAAPAPRAKDAPFVIMYHGSLVERHGLDLAVTALGKIRQSIPNAELRVYGQRTPFLDKVLASLETNGLRDAVHYLGARNLNQIVEAINACDLGVIPNRRSIFTEINTPTRIFEYLSQGKPVIAPRAPGILDYFGPDDLIYFELGDVNELAEKMEFAFREPEKVAAIARRGRAIYQLHAWSNERKRLLHVFAETLDANGLPMDADLEAGTANARGAP